MASPRRWSVAKRDGRWCVYDRGCLWDRFTDLEDAHTWATQCAVADELFTPGGLTRLSGLLRREDCP